MAYSTRQYGRFVRWLILRVSAPRSPDKSAERVQTGVIPGTYPPEWEIIIIGRTAVREKPTVWSHRPETRADIVTREKSDGPFVEAGLLP